MQYVYWQHTLGLKYILLHKDALHNTYGKSVPLSYLFQMLQNPSLEVADPKSGNFCEFWSHSYLICQIKLVTKF